jgi:hypothetical protein
MNSAGAYHKQLGWKLIIPSTMAQNSDAWNSHNLRDYHAPQATFLRCVVEIALALLLLRLLTK